MGSHNLPVSVCIPLYNGGRYLRQCIDSALAQTYSDFELLLVDDGSTDDTVAIAQTYASLDSRVRLVINPRNIGLVANWNRCIGLANGEWIKFLFQDDTIEPECLARMLDHAREGILVIACQRAIVFGEEIESDAREWYLNHRAMIAGLFSKSPVVSPAQCQEWALDHFGKNLFGEPSATMVHRAAFERFGLFNPALIMSCDLEFWTRVGIHTGVSFVPADLATFRVHKQATSAVNHRQREFRTRILDNLVILHQYAYDELYEPIRQAATRRSPPLSLKAIFDKRCHEARAMADWAARQREHPDLSLRAELKDVEKLYPRITRHEAAHWAWRLQRRLLPFLRFRAPSDAKNFLC